MGDRVEVLLGYAATALNLDQAYHVVKDGIVVDVWPSLRAEPVV